MSYNENCVFCNQEIEKRQKQLLRNDHCNFFQMPQEVLIGSGVIVPKMHRENVFELTEEEWKSTYLLLQEVKKLLDEMHQPQGYNIAWNTNKAAGQHLFHSHLHVIPRYEDEPLAGKDLRSFIGVKENKRNF